MTPPAPADGDRPPGEPVLARRSAQIVLARTADGIADVLLAGEWRLDPMTERVRGALERPGRWVDQLAQAAYRAYPQAPRDAPRELARFLLLGPPLPQVAAAALAAGRPIPAVNTRTPVPVSVVRAPWPTPRWDTVDDLARHLGLTGGELAWFADTRVYGVRSEHRLRHYRYRLLAKPAGGVRVIESPKWRLRELQRRLLHEAIVAIPAHDAAHGFRPARSVLTFAEPHTGRQVLLRMDLANFFAAVTAGRIFGIARTAGWPEPVAHVLAGLVTTVTPVDVRAQLRGRGDSAARLASALRTPHLPAGAPTSPALANLAAYRLDGRLAGLSASAGAAYTRYADDLAFSGGRDFADRVGGFARVVARIAIEEGFVLNAAKTRIAPRSGRQRLTGVVVNAHPNVARADFDRLKALLHNAVHSGPASQNLDGHADFRAHLAGRVGWVEQVNPAKGARLRRVFDRIDWPSDTGGVATEETSYP